MRRATRSTLHITLRRIICFLILPVIILLAVRFIWGVEANHRLTAVRARLLAEGIRLKPTLPTVPDDQNAALAVIDAIHAMKLSHAEQALVNDDDGPYRAFAEVDWTPAQMPELRRILANNADAFRHMRVAAELPAAHWPHTFAGLQYYKHEPINYARQFANLLYDAALCAHGDHHDAETLDDLALILHLASICDQDPAEVSHLVASALRALAAAGVERLGPAFHLNQVDGSLPAAKMLLPLLLNPQAHQDQRAIAWEAGLQAISDRFSPKIPRFWQWWFRPMSTDETARAVANLAKDVPSVRADTWPAAKSLLPPRGSEPHTILDATVRASSYNQASTSFMYSELHFRSLAATGAAALLLAARIYQSEHSHLPAHAADLAPVIIPKFPLDPFNANHAPMHYRLDPTGPTVWSVGDNGTDENATVFPPGFSNYDNLQRYGGGSDPAHNPPDIVYGAAWRIAKAKAAAENAAAATRRAAATSPAAFGPPGLPPP